MSVSQVSQGFIRVPQTPAKLRALSAVAFRKLSADGGFSFDANGTPPQNSGYMVSLPNCEVKLAQCHPVHLESYFHDNQLRAGEYFGGWRDDAGNIVLDVSIRVENRSDALELARIFKQSAIYDLEARENIYLPKPLPPMFHAGTGGIQAHSCGELYPWTIRGIGDNWQAYKMDDGQCGPIVSDYSGAEAYARRALHGNAYDHMAEVIAEDEESVTLLNSAEVW